MKLSLCTVTPLLPLVNSPGRFLYGPNPWVTLRDLKQQSGVEEILLGCQSVLL